MKRCPECRRDYADDTLLYCLEDGVALVQGSVASPDEPATAILHDMPQPLDAKTVQHVHTTNETAVLPTRSDGVSKRAIDKRLIAVPVVMAIALLGVFGGYRFFKSSTGEQINSIAVLPFQNRS